MAVDSRDRVFVFNRGEHPLIVFDRDGTLPVVVGRGALHAAARHHASAPTTAVYCTDDLDHTVRKFTPDGRLLLTLGTSGKPSDTGATSMDFRTICTRGPPFHYPTNVALAPGRRPLRHRRLRQRPRPQVHARRPAARSRGANPAAARGSSASRTASPSNRDGIVFVADRENSRIQLFTPTGEFLTEWTDVARPCQVLHRPDGRCLRRGAGLSRRDVAGHDRAEPRRHRRPRERLRPRRASSSPAGAAATNPTAAGDFFAPHDICVDSRGDIYVAEVTWSAGGNRGLVSPTATRCRSLSRLKQEFSSRSNRMDRIRNRGSWFLNPVHPVNPVSIRFPILGATDESLAVPRVRRHAARRRARAGVRRRAT